MIWRFVASAVAVALLGFAAIPTAYAASPAPISGWTGWYAGVVGGWISQDGSITNSATALPSSGVLAGAESRAFVQAIPSSVGTGSSSGTVGGELGYNWMLSPTSLIGVETDFSWTGINGSTSVTNVAPAPLSRPVTTTGSERLDWLGTARIRTGYLWTPNLLLYITGGLAYGGESSSVGVNQPPTGPHGHTVNLTSSASGAALGAAVGAGAEWRLMGNWSVKGEYLYYFLQPEILFISRASDPGFSLSSIASFQGSIVRGGLIFKF